MSLHCHLAAPIFMTFVSVSFHAQKLGAENRGGSPIEAIEYARKHISKFVDKFEKEFQLLMGTLLYVNVGLENSPYRGFCGPNLMIEVRIESASHLCAYVMCLIQLFTSFAGG